jgi:hexosaminidase
MKKFFKRFLLFVIVPIAGLIALLVAGLIIYYHALYEPEPLASQAEGDVALQVANEYNKPILLPVPKRITWAAGYFREKQIRIAAPAEDATALASVWQNRMDMKLNSGSRAAVQFLKNKNLSSQAYRLSVNPGAIKIEYSTLQAAFYALTTLSQLEFGSKNGISCVEIEDEPDLQTRGAMLDISRGKVPKLETLYTMVDFLSDLKYNQLQLYIEGFSFGYPSFARYWEPTETPLTPDEIKALDRYCRERFIELVPNQNSLGHMQEWLKQDDFKNLAECPEGYKLLGLFEVKTTLSPTDPRTLELVKQMSNDLLPNFTSTRFNVNLDEPFELGKSKQRPIDNPMDLARLYMDYAKKLNEFVQAGGRQMMMWGDVISRTPGIIGDIPKNITLLEWRYEAIQPFEQICEKYQNAGLNYMVCPGTSSWSSFTGRTDNMIGNITNAVEAGVKHGAEGMLITDWGDTPHLQYLTVSYPGLAYGGGLSWNSRSKSELPLAEYLSRDVFCDSTMTMGGLVLDLGRYNQFEEYPMLAMTTSNLALRLGMMDPVMYQAIGRKLRTGIFELASFDSLTTQRLHGMFDSPKPYQSLAAISYMSSLEDKLNNVGMDGEASGLVLDEYRNNIRMVKLAIMLKHYVLHHLEQTDDENRQGLEEMKALCATSLGEHERLWMIRNKRSGYKGSIESLEKLQADVDRQLEILDSNLVSRWTGRCVEKIMSAGIALYLN